MINLQINIRNPLSDRFTNIKCWSGQVVAHKFWEIQLYKSSDILDIFVRLTTRQSHAGVHIGFGLFGYNAEFQIYDSRHWNQNLQQWENY